MRCYFSHIPAPFILSGWTRGWTRGWTSGRTSGWTRGWTSGWTSGWTRGWTSENSKNYLQIYIRRRGGGAWGGFGFV